jgi:hypothetical protein
MKKDFSGRRRYTAVMQALIFSWVGSWAGSVAFHFSNWL